jgi:hypothetical protein
MAPRSPRLAAALRRHVPAVEDHGIVAFTGHSGAVYEYVAGYAPWKSGPANYLFARLLPSGWRIAFVGQTSDAGENFPDYDLWAEAIRSHDATHILAHVASPIFDVRAAEEADLVLSLRPPMNARRPSKPPPPQGETLGVIPEPLTLSGFARLMRRDS